MKSKTRHEGYLLIDNTFGPGTNQGITNIDGKEFIGSGEGKKVEISTITCSHCHQVFLKNPDRVRPRNYCSKCDHYICDKPACNVECMPMNKIIDMAQEEAFLQEQRTGILITN